MIRRKIHYGWLFSIFVLTLVLFVPSIHYPFFSWDDEGHVVHNRNVQTLSVTNIPSIFTSQVNHTYIPLTILSFAIEHHFFGFNPTVFHLDNILLHVLVAFLIYVFVLRLGALPLVAGLAALIFAIHPMHVEPVIWITQRKDVLYAVFYLAGLIVYMDYLKNKNWRNYWGVLVCGLFSVLAKPMALSFPLILFLIDRWFDRRLSKRAMIEKIPIFLIVGAIAGVTYAMNMRPVDISWPQSFLTWIWCFWFYLGKFFYPQNLLVLYQLPKPVSFLNPEFYCSVMGFLLVIGIVYRLRSCKWVWFAFLYYISSVFFLLRFDDVRDLTFVADRFMYLPSLGLCIGIGFILQNLWEKYSRKRLCRIIIVAGTIIIFMGIYQASLNRVNDWGSEERLWTQVAKQYSSAVASTQLGNFYLNANQEAKAVSYYQNAIAINAKYSKPYSNYAKVLIHQGKLEEALTLLSMAVSLEERPSVVLLTNRGYVFMRLGKNQEALTDLNKAIEIDQYYVPAYMNRATVFKNLRWYDESRVDLLSVLKIDRNYKPARHNIQILDVLIRNTEE